ncbi:MAG: metal-binding protein [Deltaproteobacteria bacterium]|nr:MAG: metal-binding protein [Deltaproteobacteria bacterium]
MSGYHPICAKCPFELKDRKCLNENGKNPGGCPTKKFEDKKEEFIERYFKDNLESFYKISSEVEGPPKTRIEETVYVAEKMGYKHIGLAFCIGLRKEGRIIADLFEKKGFKLSSVMCKCGNIKKKDIYKEIPEKAAGKNFCNPFLQAEALNYAHTEWNIVLGLCVGHDSIFMKYSNVMCTVLAAKDRVAAHNPLGPIYNIDSYYKFLKK